MWTGQGEQSTDRKERDDLGRGDVEGGIADPETTIVWFEDQP